MTRPNEGLVFHFPHYQKGDIGPHSAVRVGPYKLVKLYEAGRSMLFNLAKDVGERRDLAKDMPGKTSELERRLDAYLRQVKARGVSP